MPSVHFVLFSATASVRCSPGALLQGAKEKEKQVLLCVFALSRGKLAITLQLTASLIAKQHRFPRLAPDERKAAGIH
jgi:hypothetical protein